MQFALGRTYPDQYSTLFTEKITKTQDEFGCFEPPKLEVFPSPVEHFRMRAEFKLWHNDSNAHYAMYKTGEYKKPSKIASFNIGSEKICTLMPALLTEINSRQEIRNKLFQVEFLTTITGDSLITLIYHRCLDEKWQYEAMSIQNTLQTKIIGRSRGQKLILDKDYVIERFCVGGKYYHYQQVESSFTQPNASVCEKMLNWAQGACRNLGGDLLELYCGNGNFTLPLAKNFHKVLATEISKTSVNSALYNVALNTCQNISVVRMSSEELTQALEGYRKFRRLRDVDLDAYDFSTVFVDPPRAGLDKSTETMVSKFDNILYISCHPGTLRNNLKALCQTHTIKKFAFFDQFPYTQHRECGVLLTKIQ